MNALEVFCGGTPMQPLGPPLQGFPSPQLAPAAASTPAWIPKLAGLGSMQGSLVENLVLNYARHAAGWAIANALLDLKLDAKTVLLGAGVTSLLEQICQWLLQRITQ